MINVRKRLGQTGVATIAAIFVLAVAISSRPRWTSDTDGPDGRVGRDTHGGAEGA